MKKVSFSEIPIGGWFKEYEHGCWYLKTTRQCAQYRSRGVYGEPRFVGDETVLVELE